jgi:hypothetical protein
MPFLKNTILIIYDYENVCFNEMINIRFVYMRHKSPKNDS